MEPWPARSRYKQFQSVDLGDGARGVILDAWHSTGLPAYIVEVFLAEGSAGDGVVDMIETPAGGLEAYDPAELAAVKRQAPNLLPPEQQRKKRQE